MRSELMNIYSEPIAITGDEGFELTKLQTLLSDTNIDLFWNDQPWLFHQILALGTSADHDSAVLQRVVSTLCSITLILLGAKYSCRKFNLLGIMLFAAVILCSPWSFTLSLAAMTEIPAWTLALSALVCQRFISARLGFSAIVISALLFAASLHFKFTTVLILPAILTELFLTIPRVGCNKNAFCHRALQAFVLFLGVAAIAFIVFASLAPNFNLKWILGTHTSSMASAYASGSKGHPLGLDTISSLFWMFCAALLCVMLSLEKGLPAHSLPSVVLLVTVFISHSLVRPWWYYYSVHWAIGCGLVITSILANLRTSTSETARDYFGLPTSEVSRKLSAQYIGTSIGIACCLTAHFIYGMDVLKGQYDNVIQKDRVSTSPVLASIEKYRIKSRWMYTSERDYSFYSGLPIPPRGSLVIN
jgi:hypothetical protein